MGWREMLLHQVKSFAVFLCIIFIVGAATPGYSQDNSAQINLWRKAAVAGNVDAAMELADTYRQGWGVAKDEDEAFRWYQIAAGLGNAYAEFVVGQAYTTGKSGVQQNYEEAANWYLKSATLGNDAAENSLGDAYFNGLGVKQDKAAAISWYQRAATLDNPDAEYSLAEAYHHGDGIAKNDQMAVMLYKKAMDKGNLLANKRLAEMSETSYSVVSMLKESLKLQIVLVLVVLGSGFIIRDIRRQGDEQYKLNFFLSTQFALLIFSAVFFYVTYVFSGGCDPTGNITFCESGNQVAIWICLITAVIALIMNIKKSNALFGVFYTLSQFIAAYTFIPAVVIEVFREARRPLKTKK